MVVENCPSGKFLYIRGMEKNAETGVDVSVYLLDSEKLEKWFKKGIITPEGRLFCIAEEFEIKEETQTRYRLIHNGKSILESITINEGGVC